MKTLVATIELLTNNEDEQEYVELIADAVQDILSIDNVISCEVKQQTIMDSDTNSMYEPGFFSK